MTERLSSCHHTHTLALPQRENPFHKFIASWWYLMCYRFTALNLFDSCCFCPQSVVSFNLYPPLLFMLFCCHVAVFCRSTHLQRQWKREVYSNNTAAQYSQPGWFKHRITWTTLCSECHKHVHTARIHTTANMYTKWAFLFSSHLNMKSGCYLRVCGDNGNFLRIRIVYMFLLHWGEVSAIPFGSMHKSEVKWNWMSWQIELTPLGLNNVIYAF